MERLKRLSRLGLVAGIAVLVGGAGLPSAMIGPGIWEISNSATAHGDRICLSDPALLAQWEHRTMTCERVILSSSIDRAVVHYTCAGGGFGTSKVEELTPRSVRIDSQGIADGYPYARTIFAHRVGPCALH